MNRLLIFLFFSIIGCQSEIDQITGKDKRNKKQCQQARLGLILAIDNYCRSKGHDESYLPGCYSTFGISVIGESCN